MPECDIVSLGGQFLMFHRTVKPSKCQELLTQQCIVIPQKTWFFSSTAVGASDLTKKQYLCHTHSQQSFFFFLIHCMLWL